MPKQKLKKSRVVVHNNRVRSCVVVLLLVVFSIDCHAEETIFILDFELNDLTIKSEGFDESKRVAELRPRLESVLSESHSYQIKDLPEDVRVSADRGQGYLFDRPVKVSELGRQAGARWAITGRLHKASYLFVYLKSQVIDVGRGRVVADLVVEIKGWSPKLTAKGIETLAEQIDAALEAQVKQ